MRVNSGFLKGRILNSPASSGIRPTSDKVRAAIFSSLSDTINEARFLDLFAGTGAVGIEAYSRGAANVTFVEVRPETLRENVKLLPEGTFTIVARDIFKSGLKGDFDIIFIDPPYGNYSAGTIMDFIKNENLLSQNGVIVYEESSRHGAEPAELPFVLIKERRYGDTAITYWEHK